MKKTRYTLIVFLLIIVQSVLALFAGIAALFSVSLNTVPTGVYVEGFSIGGMGYPEAVKTVEDQFAEKLEGHSLLLEIEKGQTFEIPYAQIEGKVDGNATIDTIKAIKGLKDIPDLLYLYFGHSGPVLRPVVKFNEGKLRTALLELSKEVYVSPSDAKLNYREGIIGKKAETAGILLNVNNAVEVIRRQLSADPWGRVKLSPVNNFELQAVVPAVKLKDYDEIQQVLAEYTTEIVDEELLKSIELAVNTIDGTVLPAAGGPEGVSGFSFVECLKAKNVNFENDNEGYDQVASTLYAALLLAGIPVDAITRMAHELSVDYIEPGLDAWISGSGGDLKFSNPFSHKIAVFAQIEGGRVRVALAGSINDTKEKYKIKTEITQRFTPPVYNVENSSLKPGEKVILNPGKEGILVEVYRNDELIGADKYDAEKSIVQIGPGTNWKSDGK